jgi:ABC-type glycerol-3-phosphate transport system permease component
VTSWSAQRRRVGAVRSLLLLVAIMVALVPIVWTLLAAIGIQPNESTRPPTWTIVPSLDHLAEVTVAEPTFWQELATSLGVSAVAALLAVAIAFDRLAGGEVDSFPACSSWPACR